MQNKKAPKDSIYFPDSASRIKMQRAFAAILSFSAILNFIAVTPERNLLSDATTIIFVILVYLGLLVEMALIDKFLTRLSKKRLQTLEDLMNKSDYSPLHVVVKKPTWQQRLGFQVNGRSLRNAVSKDGRIYHVEYSKRMAEEFECHLYQLSSWSLISTKYAVVPLVDETLDQVG